MRFDYKTFVIGLCLITTTTSCDNEDGLDVDDISVPDGCALSAGTATNFLTSSFAFDSEADWVSGKYKTRFIRGDKLYDDVRTSATGGAQGGGLGPVYAGYSCGSCHRNAGRTEPALWSSQGSGPNGFTSALKERYLLPRLRTRTSRPKHPRSNSRRKGED